VNFGPVTPETEVWEICTFETIRQKSAYLTEYLNNYWIDFYQRLCFGRGMYADYTRAPTVASIARDDPSTLPDDDPFPRARMHHDRNAR